MFIKFMVMIGFAALGVWVLYGARDLIRLSLASYRWRFTEGVIVDSYDDSFNIPGLDRWNSSVVSVIYKETAYVYAYQVDGQTYRSNVYCFGAHAEQELADFLVGSKVRVYYDPHDPQRAVLRRGLQPSLFFGPFLLATALYIAVEMIRG